MMAMLFFALCLLLAADRSNATPDASSLTATLRFEGVGCNRASLFGVWEYILDADASKNPTSFQYFVGSFKGGMNIINITSTNATGFGLVEVTFSSAPRSFYLIVRAVNDDGRSDQVEASISTSDIGSPSPSVDTILSLRPASSPTRGYCHRGEDYFPVQLFYYGFGVPASIPRYKFCISSTLRKGNPLCDVVGWSSSNFDDHTQVFYLPFSSSMVYNRTMSLYSSVLAFTCDGNDFSNTVTRKTEIFPPSTQASPNHEGIVYTELDSSSCPPSLTALLGFWSGGKSPFEWTEYCLLYLDNAAQLTFPIACPTKWNETGDLQSITVALPIKSETYAAYFLYRSASCWYTSDIQYQKIQVPGMRKPTITRDDTFTVRSLGTSCAINSYYDQAFIGNASVDATYYYYQFWLSVVPFDVTLTYTFCLGSSFGACDVVPWVNSSESAFYYQLASTGSTYYASIYAQTCLGSSDVLHSSLQLGYIGVPTISAYAFVVTTDCLFNVANISVQVSVTSDMQARSVMLCANSSSRCDSFDYPGSNYGRYYFLVPYIPSAQVVITSIPIGCDGSKGSGQESTVTLPAASTSPYPITHSGLQVLFSSALPCNQVQVVLYYEFDNVDYTWSCVSSVDPALTGNVPLCDISPAASKRSLFGNSYVPIPVNQTVWAYAQGGLCGVPRNDSIAQITPYIYTGSDLITMQPPQLVSFLQSGCLLQLAGYIQDLYTAPYAYYCLSREITGSCNALRRTQLLGSYVLMSPGPIDGTYYFEKWFECNATSRAKSHREVSNPVVITGLNNAPNSTVSIASIDYDTNTFNFWPGEACPSAIVTLVGTPDLIHLCVSDVVDGPCLWLDQVVSNSGPNVTVYVPFPIGQLVYFTVRGINCRGSGPATTREVFIPVMSSVSGYAEYVVSLNSSTCDPPTSTLRVSSIPFTGYPFWLCVGSTATLCDLMPPTRHDANDLDFLVSVTNPPYSLYVNANMTTACGDRIESQSVSIPSATKAPNLNPLRFSYSNPYLGCPSDFVVAVKQTSNMQGMPNHINITISQGGNVIAFASAGFASSSDYVNIPVPLPDDLAPGDYLLAMSFSNCHGSVGFNQTFYYRPANSSIVSASEVSRSPSTLHPCSDLVVINAVTSPSPIALLPIVCTGTGPGLCDVSAPFSPQSASQIFVNVPFGGQPLFVSIFAQTSCGRSDLILTTADAVVRVDPQPASPSTSSIVASLSVVHPQPGDCRPALALVWNNTGLASPSFEYCIGKASSGACNPSVARGWTKVPFTITSAVTYSVQPGASYVGYVRTVNCFGAGSVYQSQTVLVRPTYLPLINSVTIDSVSCLSKYGVFTASWIFRKTSPPTSFEVCLGSSMGQCDVIPPMITTKTTLQLSARLGSYYLSITPIN